MAGYVRQSVASIVNGLNITAPPLNAEFNALQTAFNASTGHTHDGTTGEAPKIALSTSVSGYLPAIHGGVGGRNNNTATTNPTSTSDINAGYAPGSLWLNGSTGRVYVCLNNTANSAVWSEAVGIVNNAILPQITDTVDLGSSTYKFQDLYLAGLLDVATISTATIGVDTLTVNTAATFTPIVAFNGGVTITGASTINSAVLGNVTPAAITGTLITATTGFSGNLTGNVTGNVTGNLTGNVTGGVTGNVTGNVTASSGTSTFNDVTINGTLNMNSGSAGTITGLSTPSNSSDAATKGYVDTADALKLNLSGGTMSGNIAMGTNKVTGLGTPTDGSDAATKGYVDTSIATLIDSAPGALDTLNELAAALGDDPNFATTITTSIATKLNLSGGTMTGSIAMGNNKITGLGAPTDNGDATTKGYVDTADALKLNLSGGTMSGNIAMGTNLITGLGTPSADADAAPKGYVDTQRDSRLALAGGTMAGPIAMGTNKITGLGDPSNAQDAVTKNYIDTLFGSTASAATSAANALVSETNSASSAAAALASEQAALSSEQAAAASYDAFDDRYLGSKSSPPSVDNDGGALITGALYFDTTADLMKVYNGTVWLNAGSAVNGTAERQVYTATAGQTTFNATYDLGFVDVYLNGVKLVPGTDFTATNGTSISLTVGAASGDTLDIVAYGSFEVANVYTQTQSDARYATTGKSIAMAIVFGG